MGTFLFGGQAKPCDLANSVYVVLRAEGYACPLLVNRAADYRAIVKEFKKDSRCTGELQSAAITEEDSLIGPFTTLSIPALRMEEDGPAPLGLDIDVQVLDFARVSEAQVSED